MAGPKQAAKNAKGKPIRLVGGKFRFSIAVTRGCPVTIESEAELNADRAGGNGAGANGASANAAQVRGERIDSGTGNAGKKGNQQKGKKAEDQFYIVEKGDGGGVPDVERRGPYRGV
jgi:hypothetical protein